MFPLKKVGFGYWILGRVSYSVAGSREHLATLILLEVGYDLKKTDGVNGCMGITLDYQQARSQGAVIKLL